MAASVGLGRIRRLSGLAFACVLASVVACNALNDDDSELGDDQSLVIPPLVTACAASAFSSPVYSPPKNDSVALGSLLEGAGYGASTNSDWVDIASGNLCQSAEKELLLVKNQAMQFSVMHGPTPFPIAGFPFVSNAAHPWRAVAVGNLDADGFDEVVALRHVSTNGAADLFVAKANPTTCFFNSPTATAVLGNAANSDWVDVAVGNFDGGKTKKIAAMKTGHSNLFLVQYSAGVLTTVLAADLDPGSSYTWKRLAAGDLDGDGIDELVAAREVTDGKGATVMAFKWNGRGFQVFATSTFGNTGNSAWTGMTIGDFNADRKGAIVLSKNAHSNFAVMDLVPGSATLRILTTADLDSVAGQGWRGVTATDWLGSDSGAAELVTLRAAQAPYRADLLVYGNGFHRVQRDTGLDATKGAWDQSTNYAAITTHLTNTHTNALSWSFTLDTDYEQFVKFLKATQGFCVDGRQLRVWAQLAPPRNISQPDHLPITGCQVPKDLDPSLTPWNEQDDFAEPIGGDIPTVCKDYIGWGKTFGRLAQLYPHLVAVQIDDFMNNPNDIAPEVLAEMQSGMRSRAPWLNLILETYSNRMDNAPPDITRTADTLLFYFRDDLSSGHIAGSGGEQSVWRAADEVRYVQSFLPAGRKIQLGQYWGGLMVGSTFEMGTPRYNLDLMRLQMSLPNVGGFQQYPQLETSTTACNELNFTSDKYCILQRAYGTPDRPIRRQDLTAAAGAYPATGTAFGFAYPQQGVLNIAYKGTDGHVRELWRQGASIGSSDLSSLAGAPSATGDVRAYVYDPAATQNVVYRGTDGHVHALWWTTGPVGHDDLSALAGAPNAVSDPTPYVFPLANTQNVVYTGTDGHVHGLWWTSGGVGNDDLTNLAHSPNSSGVAFGWMAPSPYNTQNALYRAADGHLHDLWWSLGAVRDDNLTALAGAPAPAVTTRGSAAYVSTNDNFQHAIYAGADGHLHELYWQFGAVGHDDLTNDTHAPLPATLASPSGFFTADGTSHVVFRDTLHHVRELSWTNGGVMDDDLTAVTNGPNAAGDPTGYVAPDGSRRIIYVGVDNHIHEILH